MFQRIKMFLQGKRNQLSFKIIVCDRKCITSYNQIALGYIEKTKFSIDWNIFWDKISHGAKLNKSTYERITKLHKHFELDENNTGNIQKIIYHKHVA